jgi:hypothetical protein
MDGHTTTGETIIPAFRTPNLFVQKLLGVPVIYASQATNSSIKMGKLGNAHGWVTWL